MAAALAVMSFTAYTTTAQNVGIGTNTPHPSAKLHIEDASRGLLVPTISIPNAATSAPVTAPAQGLLVWNNNAATVGGNGVGFYYWGGTAWVQLSTSSGTDDQNLTNATLTGTNLTIAIENGNPVTVNLASLVNDADHVVGNEYNTAFTLAGNNLILTDGGGARTVDLSALNKSERNGLRNVGNFIHLGGPLIENTNVTAQNFALNFNLDGTGDFNIQDNGVNKLTVLDNGTTRFGGDVEWRDENTGGTLLANLLDDGNDGRFLIRENGGVSVDLDANSQFVFNEQGLDRNFRVESDGNTNMFFLDAGTNRVGVGTGIPTEAMHVQGGQRVTTGAVIGQHTTYGTHLLTAAAANPSIQLGAMSFNQVESGRLTFEENVPGYPTAAGNYCGFRIYHNGAANTLSISSACTGDVERMTFERGGDIGIATNNPTARFSVNGIANKTGGGNWAVFSDARLKKDITDYKEGLDLITKVRTVNFSYNSKMEEIWGEDALNKNRVYQGVIAQELQQIAPDMVREVRLDNDQNAEDADHTGTTPEAPEAYLEVDPNKFTYALINAVKEQQVQIGALKKEVEALKAAQQNTVSK